MKGSSALSRLLILVKCLRVFHATLAMLLTFAMALGQTAADDSQAIPPVSFVTGVANCCTDEPPSACCTWASSSYLLYWVKDGPLPGPLVTTSTNPADVGALGAPSTRVLFGDSGLDYGTFSGLRASLGSWLESNRVVGIEASGLLLEQRSLGFAVRSGAGGTPLLAIPAFDPTAQTMGPFVTLPPGVTPPAEAGLFITQPGSFAGGIAVTSASRLWDAEFNGIVNLVRGPQFQVDLLTGFRYLDLAESLTISTDSLGLAGSGSFAGAFFTTADHFETRSQFYGGQVGARLELHRGKVHGSLLGKLALGSTHDVVERGGLTTIRNSQDPATPTGTFAGGLLALPTNIGRQTEEHFAVVPEVQAQIAYDWTPGVRTFVGYDFLWVSSVVRPGDQIDRAVNLSQVPAFGGAGLSGPARPAPLFETSDFWAHGVRLGIEFRY